jgi:lysophospholipase L1-like esterase
LEGTGLTPIFAPHPFLNFALNPAATYLGQAQFDARFLIRRREAVRPRSAVRWRVLVLGGSTTFNDGVAREQDTWVWRLEERLRAAYGADVDVINGGVSGYALVDNLLHYTLLLRALEPDLIVLFTGINDVHPRLFAGPRPDHAHARRRWAGGSSQVVDRLRPFVASRAVQLYLARGVRAGALGHIYASVMPDYPAPATWTASLAQNGPETYAQQLDFAVRTFSAQGARVAMLPQVWLPRDGDARDAAFGVGVAEHNVVNERVARAHGLPFGAGLASAFERADVWDNCHFNPAGNVKMAALVEAFLRESGLTPPSGRP